MYLYILFIIVLILLMSYENFTNNNIKILDKKEVVDIIINDEDKYYDKFNKIDLHVRNVSSVKEYKQKIINSPITISTNEKEQIINTINKIDNILYNYKIIGFDGKKACQIKWIVGIIDGTNYENGYPHTRSNIIIIPKKIIFSDNLLKILIHEKVHIYQKTFPKDIEQYLSNNKFKKIQIKINNKRANPDIDNYTYTDSNNNILSCMYNNNASSIMDVTYYPINNPMYDHPYEYMAYTIEKDILNLVK
jgi:hypothetical protein